MERKVEAWERASIVSIMSSMVAHELKQPLTVIENYAQSLLSRQKTWICADSTGNADFCDAED